MDNKMQLFIAKREEPELPPENLNKLLGEDLYRVDTDSMKVLGDEFKLWVQIYKLNMTKTPATFVKLAQILDGCLDRKAILSNLHVLESWGLVEIQYGATGPDRAGRLYFIDNDHVHEIRGIYEEHVRPLEKENDRVSYVRGLIIEQ